MRASQSECCRAFISRSVVSSARIDAVRLDGIARQSSLGYFNDGHHVLADDGGFAVAAVAVRLGLAS